MLGIGLTVSLIRNTRTKQRDVSKLSLFNQTHMRYADLVTEKDRAIREATEVPRMRQGHLEV